MLAVIDGRDLMAPPHVPRPDPGAEGGASRADEDVRKIVRQVQLEGDDALIELTQKLDRVRLPPERLRVDPEEIGRSRKLVRPELLDALEVMEERLRATCERQMPRPWMERREDEFVGQLVKPLRRVGIYAPGGRAAYPSSVIMAATPARVAGVDGIAVCSPPGPGGDLPDAVLAACSVAGIDEVYRMGGGQAIAAFAYGTQTVRPVEKIVGPGNVYVTLAKRLVSGWVGVDTEAGPTEIAIIADGSADARVVAADLIAQAEHGPLGAHVLITWSPELAQRVSDALELQVMGHERPEDVENALIEGGCAVLVRDVDHALETANAFAPEHLELIFPGALDYVEKVRNAGSVFVGADSPASVGDYVGGTNHILPSGGAARWSSGLGAEDFVKLIYVSGFERSALERLVAHVDAVAEAEGLRAHARAIHLRLGDTSVAGL